MPEPILLTDNNEYSLQKLGVIDSDDKDSLLASLHKIADVDIAELKNDSRFLLFANKDKITDQRQRIFTINKDPYSDDYSIVTGNCAGFIGIDDVQVSIHSRFASGKDDYFLHYMLSKVFCVNLLNLKHGQKQGDLFDFLVFLFPYFLRSALRKGIVHSYVRYEYNDSNIKGPVNVPRFLKMDNPFMGRIAYDKREYSADNSLTELVRHTIEYIRSGPYSNILKSGDVATSVRTIVEVTSSYDKAKREYVINRNLKPVRHPYYSEWTELQKICLMILRHRKLNYAESKDKIYGIVFDVSWLWEEYLNTQLYELGFSHPRNKDREGKQHLFKGIKNSFCYPDFFQRERRCVIDAKYKRYEDCLNVTDITTKYKDDLYQMITYLHVLRGNPDVGLFAYPAREGRFMGVCPVELEGLGGRIGSVGLEIPQNVDSFRQFAEKMNNSEKNLKASILQYLSIQDGE